MRFADFKPGLVIEHGSYTVSEEEIIRFAREFDPQWFHTDPERARKSRWGGLIASGWHTGALAMKLAIAAYIGDSDSTGSPGLEHLKWLLPLRPGDTIRLRVEVLDTSRSKSGSTGFVRTQWLLFNQRDEVILDLVATGMYDLS